MNVFGFLKYVINIVVELYCLLGFNIEVIFNVIKLVILFKYFIILEFDS